MDSDQMHGFQIHDPSGHVGPWNQCSGEALFQPLLVSVADFKFIPYTDRDFRLPSSSPSVYHIVFERVLAFIIFGEESEHRIDLRHLLLDLELCKNSARIKGTEELLDEKSPAWNKGSIHYVDTSNVEVLNANVAQFEKDMEMLLNARAEEIVEEYAPFPSKASSTHQNYDQICYDMLQLHRLRRLEIKGKYRNVDDFEMDSIELTTEADSGTDVTGNKSKRGWFSRRFPILSLNLRRTPSIPSFCPSIPQFFLLYPCARHFSDEDDSGGCAVRVATLPILSPFSLICPNLLPPFYTLSVLTPLDLSNGVYDVVYGQ
ncbi:hypothetical protein BC332_20922 [Capsicum chinense]|nr:hypothetical protein BC332_20922 [Capsicum chinense]